MLPQPTMQAPQTCASACAYALIHDNIAVNAENALPFLQWRAIIYWQQAGETAFVDWVLIRAEQNKINANNMSMHIQYVYSA